MNSKQHAHFVRKPGLNKIGDLARSILG